MHIQKRHTCSGHNAALYCLAPGATPRHFLTAGGEGWIVEWNADDPENGRLIASVDTQVFSLCTIPAGGLIIAGNMQGGVHWVVRDQPEQTRNVQQHAGSVYAILPWNDRVFTAGGDGVLTRWLVDNKRPEDSLHVSNKALRSLACHPDGHLLAAGASDGAIYLIEAESMALLRRLPEAHPPSVFAIAFSPDGRYLLSGGRDAMLRVWDVQRDFEPVSAQPAHLYTINHILYAPDATFFVTASRDKTLKVWDAATFQLLKVADTIRNGCHINSVNRLLWAGDTLVSCSDDRSAMLWEIQR